MQTMRAYRMIEWGRAPEFQEVPVPSPGPGQVVVKMAGAGLCGSDLHVMHAPPGFWPQDPPFTLGHENAGTVSAVGVGVLDLAEGDGVLVSGVGFCGSCDRCESGLQNECRNLVMAGYGIGRDGGLAEYILVDAHHAIPIGDLDPRLAAPLADAGATSYHAVREQLPRLRPGSTAAVIGVGGLGAYAVQYLEKLTSARVVALDTKEHRLADAARLGAEETVLSGEDAVEQVRDLMGGPVDVVFDFVGATPTLRTAIDIIGVGGRVVVAGIGGGEVPMGWEKLPMNGQFINSTGFTPAEYREIAAMAAVGELELRATEFAFDDVEQGFAALRDGTVEGRALVVF